MGNSPGSLESLKRESLDSARANAEMLAQVDWEPIEHKSVEYLSTYAERTVQVLREGVDRYIEISDLAVRNEGKTVTYAEIVGFTEAGQKLKTLSHKLRDMNTHTLQQTEQKGATGVWMLVLLETATALDRIERVASRLKLAELNATSVLKRVEDLDESASMLVKARIGYNELSGDVKKLEEQLRGAAALDLANKQMSEFGHAAAAHRAWSGRWLWAAGATTAVLLALTCYSVFLAPGPPLPRESSTVAANLAHFSARGLVVVLLSFLLVVFVRNYRVAKHNEETNGHRLRALGTFGPLVAAAGDDKDAQRAILAQACAAIFAPSDTGFTGQHTPDRPPFLEIMKPGG